MHEFYTNLLGDTFGICKEREGVAQAYRLRRQQRLNCKGDVGTHSSSSASFWNAAPPCCGSPPSGNWNQYHKKRASRN